MEENSFLALLARLCGDITVNKNNDSNAIVQLQQAVASAIFNDPALSASSSFQFEKIENFPTHHLDAADLQHLNNIIQGIKDNPQSVDNTIRVFKREVPFISSQVRSSLPDWGRGGNIVNTFGPFTNKDGRKFWFDFYRIIPVVQVWLQGAAQPFMLLPLEVRNIINIIGPRSYKIPKGSVWIHADLFATAAPDNLFCGLTVAGGTLSFTGPLTISAGNKLIIPVGMEATIKLNLEQKIVADVPPDDNGIDIKEATIKLPEILNISINHTGKSLEAGAASWNLYGQNINFAFDNTKPMQWSPELNRILVPYKADVAALEVLQCKSPVCVVNGKAAIALSAWALSAAAININAPLQADGTGAMAVGVVQGITVSWLGLKDANLFEKSNTQLKNALVMLMPGRINIATLFAANQTGRQRYNLWQETVNGIEKPLQYIDLFYTKQFFFFYDCLQNGTESISTQANCKNYVDKPVQVNGMPFKVESLQTILTLSISKAFQIAMLYDDNIINDNFLKNYKPVPGVPVPPITFETTAIALNNALLAVSPVYGMLLYGDLKTAGSFDKCLLVYSFGLLHYLPTLPDPYAANISLLRRGLKREVFTNNNVSGHVNKYSITEINALLVCLINWQNMDVPSVNFFLGDKPTNTVQANASTNTEIPEQKREGFQINTLQNQELINNEVRNNLTATFAKQNKNWQAATDNNEAVNKMLNEDMQAMMRVHDGLSQGNISPFRNAFTLLDVSTNADLMGVSLGFSNDRFIFERTHVVQDAANPISIIGMDVHATSRLVQMYALPQISWEPVINITTEITNVATDPFPGLLYFLNDGVPAQIANIGNKAVPIAPIPLSKKLTEWYKSEPDFAAWSFFTLPYGMLALAKYQKQNDGNSPKLELIEQKFPGNLHTGLQIKTVGLNDPINKNKKFFGSAHQLSNTYNLFFPATGARSMLSGSVTEIFNDEFGTLTGFDLSKYVPLERYDFSGYGANVFSHWVNENAALAQTSQAMFDVWRGRTAHEVIQVKSVVYPWGIRVVRTITIYRGSNGFPWRIDSGWKAESDGIYDFRSPLKDTGGLAAAIAEENSHTYKFHPGVVEGVFNVRNIKEDTTLAPFAKPWNKDYGVFIDNQGHAQAVPKPGGQPLNIKLTPVYFDADVQIDDVTQGASNGKVVSQRMLGYLQLSPRGVFIDEESFADLLTLMNGLGGPVDCMVKINQTKQQMRITRVEVNPSKDEASKRVFVAAAKGTPVLPKDGSWSVVQHDATSKEVTPLSNNDVIPLIRKGFRDFQPGTLNYVQDKLTHPLNIAESTELFKDLESRGKQFAFLQSTGENKVLFRNPLFEKGKNLLKGSVPDLADAYRLMNSKGIFPKLENLPKLDEIGDAINKFGVNIIDEGYKLLNNTVADAEKKLVQLLPPGPWYIVNTNDVKVYIEYKPTKPNPADNPPGGKAQLDFDIDSKAREWVNKMNDITMVVDLVSFKRLVLIRGKFDTKKGKSPSFIGPELEFGPDLKPVVDILVLLSMIATDASYTDILKKGLKIAMSNSPNNWEYKFQADKEIPVLKFPPPLLDTAAAPLRLEAGLKVGVFFNVAIPLPPTNGIPMPSAGAFVEFYGKLSVMCVSVGVGTIYAVGQVTVRISADTVKGPALYMKFGFGVEAVVALPVIGSVSVYFAVGVEMSLDSTQITIGAFVLFKGRAEILGGIVTVTIQIEASGKVQKRIGGPSGETNMIAQVTFSLDISICFIINISFSESWQEQRQIA